MKIKALHLRISAPEIYAFFLLLYSMTLLPITLYFISLQKVLFLEWEIISISTTSITLPLILDSVSLSFSNIICFISGCVMLFSCYYMSEEIFLSRFCYLVMLFVLSMNSLVFIPSLVSLLLGWDGLGITSFALVVYYQNHKSASAGMLTALVNRIGDVMILLSISLSFPLGHWNIMLLWDQGTAPILALCIVIAAMTKSAQVPFSTWLPAAMAAPTPVSALVHSSTLVTAGVFLLIRFFPLLDNLPWLTTMLLFTAMLTMLMSGINAMHEYDMKKIIALSTLSQLSVMMFSLGLHLPTLALFHLYTHAMFKAMLFLCAGVIIHNNNDIQDLRQLGGLASQLPLSTSALNLANLALCGTPFLSGFYSKDAILETSLSSNTNFILIMTAFFATGLTTAYSLRLSIYTLWAQKNHMPFHANSDESPLATTPIVMLAIPSIISGKLLQEIIPQFSHNIFIPTQLKTLTLVVIFLGFWSTTIPWKITQPRCPLPTKTAFFGSLMWFLAPLITQPTTKTTLSLSKTMTKHLDNGWIESLSGAGISDFTIKLAQKNQILQSKSISITLTLMLMTALFCLMLTI
uniref:NADH-ubiquinone oxidoreductase chain 5 n=1 Tax=Fissurella volcano TaxID=707972 RepID=H6V541_FISVO|nr:NADH dehydrogenase subunit 5 [Fissurella volcano]AFB78093.1 NADH dehydrogenase subunit 5 [Fissurella volcano]